MGVGGEDPGLGGRRIVKFSSMLEHNFYSLLCIHILETGTTTRKLHTLLNWNHTHPKLESHELLL
jgi:hypothetical protein